MKRLGSRIVPAMAALALALACRMDVAAQAEFLRGDVNIDGRLSTSDALMGRRHLFLGGPLDCPNALDVDDSGRVNLTDTVVILNFLYRGGGSPASPYPDVGLDPTESPDLDCPSYAPAPPEETDDVVEIGTVSGAPGEEVHVPVYVDSAREVEAVQLLLAYDPVTFLPASGGTLVLEGTYYDGLELRASFMVQSPDASAGILRVGFVPHLAYDKLSLPPHTVLPAFKIRGHIAASAEPGTVVELTPVNGPGGEGYGPAGMRNELTHRGEARLVSTEPLLVSGILQIVGDQIFFRGDSNGDGGIDISDARFTLDYLFLAGPAPRCEDAADANDDGELNIADPVTVLLYLFDGAAELPAPSAQAGRDPTPDALSCLGAGS